MMRNIMASSLSHQQAALSCSQQSAPLETLELKHLQVEVELQDSVTDSATGKQTVPVNRCLAGTPKLSTLVFSEIRYLPACTDDLMPQNEIDAVRALLTAKPRPVGWTERRQRLDEIGSIWPVAEDVQLTPVDLDGVPGEWSLIPGSDTGCVLLFFHGGGYCSGSVLSHRRMVTEAGRTGGVRTLAVGYRLAPEHPFPAALDDALTAWRFLRKQGIAAGRIAVGGDSAGAGLTAALINTLRDAREARPACAWLVSPWTDLTMSGSTLTTKDTIDPIIHKAYLEELARAYLPGGMDRKDPRVSPLYSDLSGFPPALIQVGSAETLLADATRFAGALGTADVTVTLEIWPHMIHAWHLWNAHLECARRALASAGAFIRNHLRDPRASGLAP
jgi:acetyl esterase/lipase